MLVPAWSSGYVASFLALVVAISKPSKPFDDPQSYHPISLLCVPYKIFKRLIYNRVEPIVNSLLPKEQGGFRHGKSSVFSGRFAYSKH